MATDTKNTPTVVQTRGKGQLVHTGRAFSARFGRGGKLIPLHTNDRELAKVRMAELLAGAAVPVPGVETFKEACLRLVVAGTIVTWEERLSRLTRYAWPMLGALPVTEIKSGQISAVLASAVKSGLNSRSALDHLRVDMLVVFGELVRDEILTRNPAAAELTRTPTVVKDKRKRTPLTDEEFLQFIGCAAAPRHLRCMAVVSRCFGGLRNSDLYAWHYEDIDLEGWAWADAPRPKTEHHDDSEAARERLELHELVVAWMKGWWIDAGRPTSGPVFPNQIKNLARDLRKALLLAGVDRHELHHDTRTSRRTDFYSFRRGWVTAIATSGMNAQMAMRASGHRSMTTHQRYIPSPTIAIPAGAVPTPTVVQADDFEAALAQWDPTVVQFTEVTTGIVSSIAQVSRPQGDLNPSFRRERPSRGQAHIHSTCQEETKLSWGGAVLRELFGGPE